jgi:hypothetical protein
MSAHSKVDLFVHFVWSTAGRRKVLLPQFNRGGARGGGYIRRQREHHARAGILAHHE